MKSEIDDNLVINHPDFVNTFFGEVPQLLEVTPAVFEMCKNTHPLYTGSYIDIKHEVKRKK